MMNQNSNSQNACSNCGAITWQVWTALVLLLVNCFLFDGLASAKEVFQSETIQEMAPQETVPQTDNESLVEFLSLDVATTNSRVTGQPIMILFRASWCASCTQMTHELQSAEFQAVKSEWNLVSIDLDRDEEAVSIFRVDAVPTVILLDPAGTVVARQTGMVEAGDLVKWLKSGRKIAVPEPPVVLVGNEAPTKTESIELIELMGSTSPEVREVAIARMASFPEKTRSRAVDALSEAGLASRLGLIDLLGRWQAPLDGIDPWDSASLTDERLTKLKVWCDSPVDKLGQTLDTITPEQLADAIRELDQFLSDSTETTRLLPRFSRYGKHLLPAVYERLGRTELDAGRQRLLALRYWLVAGNQLRLSWSSGFVQLGDIDLDGRRAAVREVLNRVSSQDADLLLELFGDSDPLIREMSLKGLQKVGASQTDEALIRLLTDPDLNVRAAVLKLLAEQKPERMIPHVAVYLEKEQDSDLIVHGLRFFRETAKETQQLPVLIKLAGNSSWQVRAMVAEVLGQMGSNYNTPAQIRIAVAETLMKLVDDQDAFVVTRAVEHMPAPKTAATMDRLAAIVTSRPELAAKVVTVMAKSESDFDSSSRSNVSPVSHFLRFAEDERPEVRVAGIAGLTTTSINKIDFEKSLADPAVAVRIAASGAFMARLDGERHYSEDVSGPSRATSGTFREPESSPTLMQSIFGMFGGSSDSRPSVKVPQKVEMAETTGLAISNDEHAKENGKPETVEPKQTPREERLKKLPRESAERWINDWASETGKRPDWVQESLPLLETMATSEDPEEKLPAILALVAVNSRQEQIDQLFELATASADTFQGAAGTLKWLPFEKRDALFHRMIDQPKFHDLKNGVVVEYSGVRSLAAAETLWELSAHKDLNPQALFQAIHKAYFGDDHSSYYTLNTNQEINSFLLEEVTAQMTGRINDSRSNSLTRQIALTMLYWMNAQNAAKIAGELLETNSDSEVTNIALQIRLASLETSKLEAGAVPLLKRVNDAGKKTILQTLAYERERGYRFSSDGSLQIPANNSSIFYSESGNEPKLRVPKAPAGLDAADFVTLLESEDAESRALATYYSILLDDTQPVAGMIEYWSRNKNDAHLSLMVVDVVSLREDDLMVPLLEEIYKLHGGRDRSAFSSTLYWTIRSMSGPSAMALRQRIRQEVGMDRLN